MSLLTETQSSEEGPRKNAEWQLKQQYNNADFPTALIAVGSHSDVPIAVRQAALLYLKTFVLACWSPQFDEFTGQLYSDEAKKAQIRQSLLDLALSGRDERKIKSAASLVVSKIATADFPDEWPDLLATVLEIVGQGNEAQLQGALKVLNELVDDCFTKNSSSRWPEIWSKLCMMLLSTTLRNPHFAHWLFPCFDHVWIPWRW